MFIKNLLVSLAQKQALKHVKTIVENSNNNYPKIDNPKKIIFNRVYTTYAESSYNEVGIAKSLQHMGHNVKFYLCGQKLWNCSAVFTMKQPPDNKICNNCKKFGTSFLSICNIPYETYEEILKNKSYKIPDDKEEIESYVYKGIKIGEYVRDSALRFYKGMNPSKTQYNYEDILKERMQNALMSLDVAEYSYKKEKPDILYTSHGCYSEWGGFTDYYRKKGVKCIIWDYVYGKNYIFNTHFFRSKIYKDYFKKHKSLNTNQRKELINYLTKRSSGKADTQVYKFDPNKKADEIISKSKYKHTFVMFPNVPWDTSLVHADKAFANVYDYVDCTIKHFKDHPDDLLIIKIHPAEISDGSFSTVKDYIDENHSLTSNIKIIDVDTDISSYSLIEKTDAGIVYNGTIGLEMSIKGKPVILGGLAHYGGNGFTYDVQNKKQYYKLLKSPPKKLDKSMIKLAENYGYFYFIASNTPRTYVEHKNRAIIAFNVNNFEELLNRTDIKKISKFLLKDVLFQDI